MSYHACLLMSYGSQDPSIQHFWQWLKQSEIRNMLTLPPANQPLALSILLLPRKVSQTKQLCPRTRALPRVLAAWAAFLAARHSRDWDGWNRWAMVSVSVRHFSVGTVGFNTPTSRNVKVALEPCLVGCLMFNDWTGMVWGMGSVLLSTCNSR